MAGFGGFVRESGAYPPGAEFDPRAPWNEKAPPMWSCDICGEEHLDWDMKYECLDGDVCCTACLAEALDLALVEVEKLRAQVREREPEVAQVRGWAFS